MVILGNFYEKLYKIYKDLNCKISKPSFNSATAKDEGQIRAIVNTFLSITASCITTFLVSSIVGKGKFNMVNITLTIKTKMIIEEIYKIKRFIFKIPP